MAFLIVVALVVLVVALLATGGLGGIALIGFLPVVAAMGYGVWMLISMTFTRRHE
jgi:hypothetical protein